MDGFAQNIRQLQTGYMQTMAKLDTVIANQKAGSNPAKTVNAVKLQVLRSQNRAKPLLSPMRQSQLT